MTEEKREKFSQPTSFLHHFIRYVWVLSSSSFTLACSFPGKTREILNYRLANEHATLNKIKLNAHSHFAQKHYIGLKNKHLFQIPSINSDSNIDFMCNHAMAFQQL